MSDRQTALRNLLIVHEPAGQELSDWLSVKERIDRKAPDIEVRIATNRARNSVTRRWQGSRPSLVFSPHVLYGYQPNGGRVYAGQDFSKVEQIERLSRRDLPPVTAVLTRDLVTDTARWGSYVVVKPQHGGKGKGVCLVQTTDLSARYDELTLDGERPMIVQPYIEHSEDGSPTSYRVLTLFGRVLYSVCNSWERPRPPLEEIAKDPNGVIASNDGRYGRLRSLCNDREIIALGERAHSAFPECPVLGVDLVRDTYSGKLYLMEVNPAGRVWHFSSPLAMNVYTAEYRAGLYAQFGALDKIAQLLIEITRKEAI